MQSNLEEYLSKVETDQGVISATTGVVRLPSPNLTATTSASSSVSAQHQQRGRLNTASTQDNSSSVPRRLSKLSDIVETSYTRMQRSQQGAYSDATMEDDPMQGGEGGDDLGGEGVGDGGSTADESVNWWDLSTSEWLPSTKSVTAAEGLESES